MPSQDELKLLNKHLIETANSVGKKFDADKPRIELVSPLALTELAKVLTFGAKKYDANNWRKGIAWSRLIGATLRHVNAYNMGQTHDEETGLSHMAHAMCETMFLLEFEKTHPELDDRYRATIVAPKLGG